MSADLRLVVDNSDEAGRRHSSSAVGALRRARADARARRRSMAAHPSQARRMRSTLQDDRGAVTAEYAIVIMAAVAFAGLLVAIMRSGEVRAMLVDLVQNALGSAG